MKILRQMNPTRIAVEFADDWDEIEFQQRRRKQCKHPEERHCLGQCGDPRVMHQAPEHADELRQKHCSSPRICSGPINCIRGSTKHSLLCFFILLWRPPSQATRIEREHGAPICYSETEHGEEVSRVKRHMSMGDFLVAYLRKIGATHVFGIRGDLALKLFFALGRRGAANHDLLHEPGVGFAADGYARATGKIGVICVTYGAGGHNMVNPVAGSFSERVPVLILSGGPGEEERKLGTLIHHQAREIESQHRIYQEVTCAAAVLTDPRRAAMQLHDVVRAIWAEQRPGYIEIHRDMVDREIEVPDELLEWDGQLRFHESDARRLEEAARETAAMFNESRKPVLIAGIEIHRYKASRELVELAEQMGAPVMTTVLGKGAFPMDHPLYMGVHVGPISPPPIIARMDEADFVLNFGCLRTDMNFGNRPPHIIEGKSVWAVDRRVDVKYHTYMNVGVRDFVRALRKQQIQRHDETVHYADNLREAIGQPNGGAALRVGEILMVVNEFLAAHKRYMVVAESGDMLFGGLDVRVPHGGTYLAQGFYASMGFAVPAALGAQIGWACVRSCSAATAAFR